jgi:hypothetical protein
MSINELSNEEVLFIYFSNNRWLERYSEIFEESGIYEELHLLDIGKITVFNKLTEEETQELKESKHYDLVSKINTLLEPVAILIEESNPELYKSVEDSFKKTLL